MANNYFQFKQFTIYQDKCAMKVTTDACLFGAWAAGLMNVGEGEQLLDIGTGTGLLSLMAVQQNNCLIEAVEIEKDAFAQAGENVVQSPWKEKIKIINADIRQLPAAKKYHCIISNPPFFENQLASPDVAKNKALHAHALSLDELFTAFEKHSHPQGSVFLLMPAYRKAEVVATAIQYGFFITRMVMVKQTPAHEPFRIMLQFNFSVGKRPGGGIEETIIIKDGSNEYSSEFTTLLKEYYLHL
jgi:tRNA1Val (adenine37-N6)-methyltransferase